MRSISSVVLAVGVAVAFAGCQSTQDKSAKLAKEGRKAFSEKGVVVQTRAGNIKVVQTAALQDQNGAAAVVVLRSQAPTALANIPISINVVGAGGASVFKNDAPGLEPSLTSASSLPARGVLYWVNDQVTPSGTVKAVKPAVGTAGKQLTGSLPRIDLSNPTLTVDPVSGIEATGKATSHAKTDQTKLIIYCVARKGSKVVAAGRAQIPRLRPGKPTPFHVFFIGDPRGAQLTLAAPPTVLQ